MAELKTKRTNASVSKFIATVADEQKRADSKQLVEIFSKATGYQPAIWGDSIIGFGCYHYKSERSSQEGDWMLTAFSPRKQNISLYIMSGPEKHGDLLKKLGKHKASKGCCLYIKRLSDIDTNILQKIISASVADMKRNYQCRP